MVSSGPLEQAARQREEADKKSLPRRKRKNQETKEKQEELRYFLTETSTSSESQCHIVTPC
jgi:hypothetical protein